jgi:hypothetical protein
VNPWDMPKVKKEIEDATYEIIEKYQADSCDEISQLFLVVHSEN